MDDFDRNVWCLLGLPFDAIDLETTVRKVHEAARDRTPFFISTPNLNFLITSQKDPAFRDSVINSDLSVADGKPLIWIARLLNIPLPERVAGSDLIESLIENKEGNKPLKVFFFGGMEGIAEQACKNLNAQNKGLKCVGFHCPGFGSVDEMSSIETIDKINQSGADFVIVSLGAKKGQAWIEHNRSRLTAPIISHLGAVVNFIAGNVTRSPKLMQKLGLEWLWRIKEEPSLWKRYLQDGISLLGLVFLKVFPYWILLFLHKNKKIFESADVSVLKNNKNQIDVKFTGFGTEPCLDNLRHKLSEAKMNSGEVIIDLSNVAYMDSAFLGLLFVMKKKFKDDNNIIIKPVPKNLNRIMHYNGFVK